MPDVLNPDTITSPAELAGDELIDLVADAPAGVLEALDLGAPVVDDGLANWIVDKLVGYDEQEARLDAQYKTMKAELKSKRDRFSSRFLLPLEEYFRANLPKKGKSIKLLTGTIGLRTVKGGARIRDEEACREWAMQELPEAVTPRTVFDLDKDAIRKHALAAGEVIPGVELVPDEDRFYVKGAKGGDE